MIQENKMNELFPESMKIYWIKEEPVNTKADEETALKEAKPDANHGQSL